MKILTNARIHTLDHSVPQADTIVLYGDRIRAVGGKELLSQFTFAPVENMRERVILPGLTDAHVHLQKLAQSRYFLDCGVGSKGLCVSSVREYVRKNPNEIWIRGHGWDQNVWEDGWPSANDLDSVTSGKPAYLTSKSLHSVWVNSKALQLAGISGSTPDPAGGRILRDETGNPTGVLIDEAMKLIENVIPEPDPFDLAETIRETIPSLWSVGLTGVHDFDGKTCFQALQILHARGDLKFRVQKSIPNILLPQAVDLGLRTGFGDDFFRIGPVKCFADGALGSHTAAMFEPYVDDPQNRGILMMDAGQTFNQGCNAVNSGISLAVHAIGDRAVHEVLEGFSRLRTYEKERGLPPLRHRIEHVQTLAPEDAGKMAEMGVIASMQPTHAVSDMIMADDLLGARSANAYAWRTLINAGTRVIFGSDAPVESPNPFEGLSAAVTRRRLDGTPGSEGWHPEQRLSVREAVEGFTIGPAYAAGMENQIGRLSPGYLADLIVLEVDPFACSDDELASIQPLETMVGGEWVWKTGK